MRARSFLTIVLALVTAASASAAVELNLSAPPASLAPGEQFTLQVNLLPPTANEQVTSATMRLKASSSGVLDLISVSPPPGEIWVQIWPLPYLGPLNPYSHDFGFHTPDGVTPVPSGEHITLGLRVLPATPAGDYTLSLDNVIWSNPDFETFYAVGNSVNVHVTPEPAALTLLALTACMLRRRRAAR